MLDAATLCQLQDLTPCAHFHPTYRHDLHSTSYLMYFRTEAYPRMWYWIALPSRSRTRKVETCVGQQRRYNESSVRHSETENTYSAEGAVCSRTYECVREAIERKSERQGEHVASGGGPFPPAHPRLPKCRGALRVRRRQVRKRRSPTITCLSDCPCTARTT